MSLDFQELIILTSPPASGKTYWISSFSDLYQEKLLVISPLRALADECNEKWSDQVLVMTPEEWLGRKEIRRVVIFDEFHLFLYWGDSFRPLMWEMFFEASATAELVILLTATMSDEMKEVVKTFESHFHSLIWVDFGNQKLRFFPTNYLKAPSRSWVLREIFSEPKEDEVKLIFCQYRQEVFDLEQKLTRMGYLCLSCVGGESRHMKEKLAKNPCPDFIISTTVLSHGVNLPRIRKIYFLYQVKNLDFWIQMVARGGRRGESFDVVALEKPYLMKWNPFINYLAICFRTMKQNLSLKRISL